MHVFRAHLRKSPGKQSEINYVLVVFDKPIYLFFLIENVVVTFRHCFNELCRRIEGLLQCHSERANLPIRSHTAWDQTVGTVFFLN